MSRRKQRRPKSLKDEDISFVLPDEIVFDETSNCIITRANLEQDHCFGPFSAVSQIEDRIECFQLLNIKHNWLAHCSILKNLSVNLNLVFENNQLFAVTKESIPVGTKLCTDKIILPKLTMNKDVQIKKEATHTERKARSEQKNTARCFICCTCDIRFSNQATLDAHRQHYCMKRETTKSHSTDTIVTIGMKGIKRKPSDIIDLSPTSPKRLSLLSQDTYCHECDTLFSKTDNFIQHKLYYCRNKSTSLYNIKDRPISFDRSVQIGPFIYVPIPIMTMQNDISNENNEPLDLSKPKRNADENERMDLPLDLSFERKKNIIKQQSYRCEYCLTCFRSSKTLQAHQENYCMEYRKQSNNDDTQPSRNTHDDDRSPSSSSSSSSPSLYITKAPTSDSYDETYEILRFICRRCQYQGNSLRNLRIHLKHHQSNNVYCSSNDIILQPAERDSLAIPIQTNQSLLKCTICSAMFDCEETLLNHVICVHTNEKLHECLECQSRFTSNWNLIGHMKLVHTNLRNDVDIVADDIDERMKSRQKLFDENDRSLKLMNLAQQKQTIPIDAIKAVHKKLVCPFCHIKFSKIDTLQQHMTTYCSSRPTFDDTQKSSRKGRSTYCCSCKISFQHKDSYDAHKTFYCPDTCKAHIKILT